MAPEPVFSDVRSAEGMRIRYAHRSEGSLPYMEIVRYRGAVTPFEQYQEALEAMLDRAEEEGCQRLFLDQYELEGIDLKSRIWLVGDYIPRMRQRLSGTLRLALILPKGKQASIVGKSLMYLYAKLLRDLRMQTFSNQAEAKQWIATDGMGKR